MITAITTTFVKPGQLVDVVINGSPACLPDSYNTYRDYTGVLIEDENIAIAGGKGGKRWFLLQTQLGNFIAKIVHMQGNNDPVSPVPFSATYELLYNAPTEEDKAKLVIGYPRS